MIYNFYPKNKYRNNKIKVNGVTFDSQKEYARYLELKLLERAGEITDLETQKEFLLIPNQEGEKKVTYRADFYYKTKDGKVVVEDVKSAATKKEKAYVIKRKLMLHVHNIKITEIL